MAASNWPTAAARRAGASNPLLPFADDRFGQTPSVAEGGTSFATRSRAASTMSRCATTAARPTMGPSPGIIRISGPARAIVSARPASSPSSEPPLFRSTPVTIRVDGEDVQLIPIRSAHTDRDTLVSFPKHDILAVGDYFLWCERQRFVTIPALRKIRALSHKEPI
jgi:hypothetical protein